MNKSGVCKGFWGPGTGTPVWFDGLKANEKCTSGYCENVREE